MVKGSMIRPRGLGTYHYIMAYHHRVQINSSLVRSAEKFGKKLAFHELAVVVADGSPVVQHLKRNVFFQNLGINVARNVYNNLSLLLYSDSFCFGVSGGAPSCVAGYSFFYYFIYVLVFF